MRILGLDHVVIRCIDADRMVKFYCDVLGCTVDRHRPELGLYHLRAGCSLIDLLSVSEQTAASHNMDHFCLRIDPFDEASLRSHFNNHGIDLGRLHENYGADGTGPSFYFKDPEGNTIEIKGPPSNLTAPA